MRTQAQAFAFLGDQWMAHATVTQAPLVALEHFERVLCEDGQTVMIYATLTDGFTAAACYDLWGRA